MKATIKVGIAIAIIFFIIFVINLYRGYRAQSKELEKLRKEQESKMSLEDQIQYEITHNTYIL